MKSLLLNLLLALTWAAMTAEFSLRNLLVGFGLGFLVLLAARRMLGDVGYFGKVRQAAGFVLFFLWELLLANFRVAYDVITPRLYMRPGVVAIPLDAKTDAEITLLANLITMTPGSLSLDVSDDRRVLYVHGMFVGDVEQFRRSIKDGLERRVLELLR